MWRAAAGDGAGAPPPVQVEGWELPSMRDLFWKQQKLQRNGQTVYGNVWAGVMHLKSSSPPMTRQLLLACKPDEQSCGALVDACVLGTSEPATMCLYDPAMRTCRCL